MYLSAVTWKTPFTKELLYKWRNLTSIMLKFPSQIRLRTVFGPPYLWAPYARTQATTDKNSTKCCVRAGYAQSSLLPLFSLLCDIATIPLVFRFYQGWGKSIIYGIWKIHGWCANIMSFNISVLNVQSWWNLRGVPELSPWILRYFSILWLKAVWRLG